MLRLVVDIPPDYSFGVDELRTVLREALVHYARPREAAVRESVMAHIADPVRNKIAADRKLTIAQIMLHTSIIEGKSS